MFGTHDLWLFVVSGFVLNITPGPDNIYIAARSLHQGWRAGLVASMGIGCGVFIHVLAAALGLAALLAASATAFMLVKLVGAAYLLWLGLGLLRSRESVASESDAPAALPLWRIFRQGFITNVLNPKATLFFLSLFTFVIGNSTPLYVVLTISLIIVLTALSWFLIVSVFFTHRKVQKAFLRYEVMINRFFGGFLVLLGIKIALTLRTN